MTRFQPRQACLALGCATLLVLASVPARAHGRDPSTASSGLSMLPVAAVVAAPAVLLSGGVTLSVVAFEASATGTVWLLERASDGARASVALSGQAATAVGSMITVVAVSTGHILSCAGQAVAFVPNEIGKGLLHHERVSR